MLLLKRFAASGAPGAAALAGAALLVSTTMTVLVGPASAQQDPVRVLVVTATQGFRHSEGIDASKAFLQGIGGTEFDFDFTENPADLNAGNLESYDVLFLNNSTLRIAPTDPNDPESVAATRPFRRPPADPITAPRSVCERLEHPARVPPPRATIATTVVNERIV